MRAGLVDLPRRRLEHHPHRRGDGLEPLQLGPGHDARVEVRQQAGLLEHPDGHRPDVVEGRVVARRVEPLAGLRPAVLGPVAEGEERLLAAERRALAGDGENLVGREVRRRQLVRCGRDGAVVAAVPAQPGERDEDLLGVGDDAGAAGVGQPLVAHAGGRGGEVEQVVVAGAEQLLGLGDVEGDTVAGAAQDAPEGRGGHGRLLEEAVPATSACGGGHDSAPRTPRAATSPP